MRMNQLDTNKVYDKNMDFTITSAQAEKIEHKYEGTLTQKQLLFVESKASISFFGGSRGKNFRYVL